MGRQRDRDVVRRCGDGIATQETKHEGPPEMRREGWMNQAEKGGKGGGKRKAAWLLGLAALLEAGVLFTHKGAEAGDFLVVDGGGVGGVGVVVLEE